MNKIALAVIFAAFIVWLASNGRLTQYLTFTKKAAE